ncbi:hypothetical protein OAP63_15300 [Vibrio sp.]|nr:hypothetical protein [Vibrio sp.]
MNLAKRELGFAVISLICAIITVYVVLFSEWSHWWKTVSLVSILLLYIFSLSLNILVTRKEKEEQESKEGCEHQIN